MTEEIAEQLKEFAQKRRQERLKQRAEELREVDADELTPLSEI